MKESKEKILITLDVPCIKIQNVYLLISYGIMYIIMIYPSILILQQRYIMHGMSVN